jgi:thiamine pyrophosphokinase
VVFLLSASKGVPVMTRIIIFAHGLLNQPESLRSILTATDRIFCADGGAYHALALGLTPEYVIGDLDSLSPEFVRELETKGVKLCRYPRDKDQTDLELTLQHAIAEEPGEIVLAAALGGRLDQMLANILLLSRDEYHSTQLSLVDSGQWATLMRGPQTRVVEGQSGDILSLVPLTPLVKGVDLSGVVWPLTDATLTFGSTFTISNALAGQQATVTIREGKVLLVHFDKDFEEELRQ